MAAKIAPTSASSRGSVSLWTSKTSPPPRPSALAQAPFIATGEGAEIWRGLVEAAGGVVAEDPQSSPALSMARHAQGRVHEAIAAEAVTLHYIRPSDAALPVG
jgi:hypothetical protein